MPDRKEYIEILSKAVKTVKEYNEDTPIKISLECVEDILELLKEHEEVVRCKDCEHFEPDGIYTMCYRHNGLSPNADWFCADGKRRTDDA